MVTRGLMDALLRDPTAARRAGWWEGVWGGGRAGGGEKEEKGERLQTSKDGVGVGREGKGGWGEKRSREKKMQPPKIKSKDCIRSEQRCRNRWQLRVSEFASPFLIHELE